MRSLRNRSPFQQRHASHHGPTDRTHCGFEAREAALSAVAGMPISVCIVRQRFVSSCSVIHTARPRPASHLHGAELCHTCGSMCHLLRKHSAQSDHEHGQPWPATSCPAQVMAHQMAPLWTLSVFVCYRLSLSVIWPIRANPSSWRACDLVASTCVRVCVVAHVCSGC